MKKIRILYFILIMAIALFCACTKEPNDEKKNPVSSNIDASSANEKDKNINPNIQDNKNKQDTNLTEMEVETKDVDIQNLYFGTNQNTGNIIVNDDNMFCISDEKIYTLNENEDKMKLLFDSEKVISIKPYKNKIIFLYRDSEKGITSKLGSINKDGSEVEEICLGLNIEFSQMVFISNFDIYKEYLIFNILDNNTDDMVVTNDVYLCDLNTNTTKLIYEDIKSGTMSPLLKDNMYYCYENDDVKGQILHKYNLDSAEKEFININKNPSGECIIMSDLHFKDDYVYYSGKTYIRRDNIDGLSDSETVFFNDEFIILNMAISNQYIFFVTGEWDNTNDKLKISTYRLNADGSDCKEIFVHDNLTNTNIPPKGVSISVIGDDKLYYYDVISRKVLAINFEGDIIYQ